MYFDLLLKNESSVYEKYFSGLFNKALKLMNEAKVRKSERLLNKGSKMFFKLIKKNKCIDALTIDSCSAYLCRYYQRNENNKKLKKILNRNFVYYDGEYYSINLNNDIAVRLMSIEEEPTCDCAYDFIADDEFVDKLRKIKSAKN